MGLGCGPLELDLALAEIGLDAVKRAQEIVIPERAAEFAVGRELQADGSLLVHDLFDFHVLDLAQIESGKLALSLEPTSLAEVMFECQAMIEPQSQKRGIKMTSSCSTTASASAG